MAGARDLTEAKELPEEPFRLTEVYLSEIKQVTDTGLAAFNGCKNLTTLGLNGTPVSDTGLAHFAGCKSLKVLHLYDTKVGDAGLVHFKDCVQLKELALARTPVGDAGLAHFAGCKKLTELYLPDTQVSDASLDLIKRFTMLTTLSLTSREGDREGRRRADEGAAAVRDHARRRHHSADQEVTSPEPQRLRWG